MNGISASTLLTCLAQLDWALQNRTLTPDEKVALIDARVEIADATVPEEEVFGEEAILP